MLGLTWHRRPRYFFLPPVVPDIHRYDRYTQDNCADQGLVRVLINELPLGPDEIADECQYGDPQSRAEQGIERELQVVHPCEPGRKRDQMTDNGKQPSDERGYLAMVLEILLDLGKFFLRDPDVLAVFKKQWPAQMVGSEIVRVGAHEAPKSAAEDGDCHAHLALLREVTCGRHHQFARDRNDRTLHRHEKEDAGITESPYGQDQPVYQCMHFSTP